MIVGLTHFNLATHDHAKSPVVARPRPTAPHLADSPPPPPRPPPHISEIGPLADPKELLTEPPAREKDSPRP